MYNTRRINKHQGETYITIGDPYSKEKITRDNFKGKQFEIVSPKAKPQGHFNTYPYEPDPYELHATHKYVIEQPASTRKNGFGSKDASKRDEFCLSIRQTQWREMLQQEAKKAFQLRTAQAQTDRPSFKDLEYIDGRPRTRGRPRSKEGLKLPLIWSGLVPANSYDIGKELGTTPTCNKCSRDQFYCKHRVSVESPRRTGPHFVSNEVIGSTSAGPGFKTARPSFGRRITTNEFWDKVQNGGAM